MAGLNEVNLIGRLGKDPEVSYSQSGTAKCKFSLATSEKFKDRNGDMQEETEWHNIIIWGKQAENCGKYLSKGSQVYIKGKIQTRSWEDQQSGQKRYITEIKAFKVIFLESRGGGQGGGNQSERGGQDQGGHEGQNQGGGSQGGYSGPKDDSIPF